MLQENFDLNNKLPDNNMIDIIQNLSKIEKIASKNNINQKENNKLKEIIINCLNWSYKELKNNDSDTSLQIFQLLDYFDKKWKFEIFFKNYNFSLVNNINIATCYQINWDLKNNLKYLENSYNCLNNIILKEKKEKNYQNFLIHMKYLFLKSKICLQTAAVSSQLSNHNDSYHWGLKSFKALKKILKLINILINIKNFDKNLPFEITNLQLEYINNLNYEKKIILKYFIDLFKLIKNINENLIKNNENKNFKNINTKNLNFKKIRNDWIKYFNIGNIMHLEPISFKKINQEFFLDEFINEDFFAIITLIIGCCLFSIAAEKRFIINDFHNNNKNIFKHIKENEFHSFKHLNDPEYINSQYYHIYSIEIIERYLIKNELLKHIKTSYKKNYKNILLEEIKEEDDESNLSYLTKNNEYFDKSNTISLNNIKENLSSNSENKLNIWKKSIENIKDSFLEKNKKKLILNSPNILNKEKNRSKKKFINIENLKKKIIKKNPKIVIYNFIKKKYTKKVIFNNSKISSKSFKSKSNKNSKKNIYKKNNFSKLINNKSNKKTAHKVKIKPLLSYKKFKKKKSIKNNNHLKINKDEILKLKLNKNKSKKKLINKIKNLNLDDKKIQNNLETIKYKQNVSNLKKKNDSSYRNINKKINNNNKTKRYSNNKCTKKPNKNLNKLINKVYQIKQSKENIFKINYSNNNIKNN